MALHQALRPAINRLCAKIGEIRGRSRPIKAHNDKDGLERRHAALWGRRNIACIGRAVLMMYRNSAFRVPVNRPAGRRAESVVAAEQEHRPLCLLGAGWGEGERRGDDREQVQCDGGDRGYTTGGGGGRPIF